MHLVQKRIFISVVSHQHDNVIINFESIKLLSEFDGVEVIVRDNIPQIKLEKYCNKYKMHYCANKVKKGFSANNNANFIYAQQQLGMTDQDYFILCNPDIIIDKSNFSLLLSTLLSNEIDFSTINLFVDKEELVQDDNLRFYPKFTDFFFTYFFNQRRTMINRRKPMSDEYKWVSGAFIIIKAGIYQKVNGLDEQYYLYCEDIDFSYRLKKAGVLPVYLEDIKAIHFRRRNSKRFLSRYFFWHVRSVIRYLISRKFNLCMSSSIVTHD